MQQQSSYDFSALDRLQGFIKPMSLTFGLILMFSIISLLVALGDAFGSVLFVVCLIVLLIIITVSFVRYRRLMLNNQQVLAAFASQNKLSYKASDRMVSGPGTVLEPGDDKQRHDILSGVVDELPFEAYHYEYHTGSGKSRQRHDVMVVEVLLPRVLPQFVIDSALANVIPIVFDRSQKIELEGNFHKYFDLYAPDTYGVSALTLLAPDVMETLMRCAAFCDIEVVQDRLYFYWASPAKTRAQYEQLFTTVAAVLAETKQKLTSANIYAAPAQAALHSSVASSGVRLKRSKVGLYVTIGVVVYFSLQFAEHTPFENVAATIMTSIWIIGIVVVIVGFRKRSQLKRSYYQEYGIKK